MRVLHIYSGNLFGGVETLLVTLARERHLFPAIEPAFALCFGGRLLEELRGLGSPVYELGQVRVRRPLSVLRARSALARVLEARRFDVVVAHSVWSQALFAPVARGRCDRQVFFLHDASEGRHWLDRWARLNRPEAVVSNSRYTAGFAARLYPGLSERALGAIHPPVSPPAEGTYGTEEAAAARTALRAELGVPDRAPVIALAARMVPLKGHAQLLRAAAATSRPGWEIWIAGGAQRDDERAYERDLRAEAARLGLSGRVRFLGQRADVARLLAAADVYCQPNTSPDAFGIAFVEALYAGLPVVTTAIGGALEIVTPDAGRLVPPGDEGALARALDDVMGELEGAGRETLRSAALARAQLLCDPAARLQDLAEFLAARPREPVEKGEERRRA